MILKESPILFSGPMVRAILEGRKTQTRWQVKPQPFESSIRGEGWAWKIVRFGRYLGDLRSEIEKACPYGQPGDRLWVKETWNLIENGEPVDAVAYRADDPGQLDIWRPSIHMPRWASRITLEITKVRVERLQDISEEDATAEGVVGFWKSHHGTWKKFDEPESAMLPHTDRDAFAALWDNINCERGFGWDNNPWVCVIEFKRI